MIAQDKSPVITLNKNSTLQLTCPDNQCNYYAVHTGENSDILLCLDDTNSRVYMTDIGATLAPTKTDVYLNSQIPTAEVYFKPTKVKFFLKNNYLFGCKVDIWKIYANTDHNGSILGKLDGWFTRMTPDGSSELNYNVQMWPQNIKEFNKEYRIIDYKRFNLAAGQEGTWQTWGKGFYWSNARALDWTPPAYDSKYVTYFLLRIQGVVSHDNENQALIGFGKAACDVIYEETYKFQVAKMAPILPITQVIQGLSTMPNSEQRQEDTEESKTLH